MGFFKHIWNTFECFCEQVGSSSDIGDKASNLAGDAQNLANKAVSGAQDKVRFWRDSEPFTGEKITKSPTSAIVFEESQNYFAVWTNFSARLLRMLYTLTL